MRSESSPVGNASVDQQHQHLQSLLLVRDDSTVPYCPHRHDVISGYCSCAGSCHCDVVNSRGDVIKDVVLPTAFVRRRNERERHRVRYLYTVHREKNIRN